MGILSFVDRGVYLSSVNPITSILNLTKSALQTSCLYVCVGTLLDVAGAVVLALGPGVMAAAAGGGSTDES